MKMQWIERTRSRSCSLTGLLQEVVVMEKPQVHAGTETYGIILRNTLQRDNNVQARHRLLQTQDKMDDDDDDDDDVFKI